MKALSMVFVIALTVLASTSNACNKKFSSSKGMFDPSLVKANAQNQSFASGNESYSSDSGTVKRKH